MTTAAIGPAIGGMKVLGYCNMGANGETRYIVLGDLGADFKPEPGGKSGRFVTAWTATSMLGRGEWMLGHYFDDITEAKADFVRRIGRAEITE